MPKTPRADTADPPPPRKRRWPRRCLIATILFAVLALVFDGPGSRWIIKSVLLGQLEKQGLHGEIGLSGRLHSGYTLTDARFSGSGVIRSLSFDSLGLDYRLSGLLEKQIDALSGRNIRLVLHPPPEPEKDEEEPREPFQLEIPEDTIRMVRGLVLPVALDFRDVSVEIRRKDATPITAALDGLSHPSGDNTIRFTGLQSNVLGKDGFPSQDIRIDWKEDRIALSAVDVMPSVEVGHLEIGLPPGAPATAAGDVKLAGAAIEFEADETGSATLTLQGQSLDLRAIIDEFPIDLPLAGNLDTLVVDVDNILLPPREWRGGVKLLASNLDYRNFQVAAFQASATIAPEGIELVSAIGRNRETELVVKTPLPEAGIGTLLTDQSFDFNLELGSIDESLSWILTGLSDDPTRSPPALPSGPFSLSGRLNLDVDGRPSEVSAGFHTPELLFQGNPVPPLQGSAKLVDRHAEFAVRLAKPSAGETVGLAGSANLETGTYEARTSITLPDPGWVNALIPGDPDRWKPSGVVEIHWNGSGSFKESSHHGAVNIAQLELTTPARPPTGIDASITYGWPGSVTLDSLNIRNGNLRLSGGLSWKDDTLTIPGLEVSDQDGVLMKLNGKAPIAQSVRSLQDVLVEERPFNLTLKADRFALTRLQPFLPRDLLDGYAAEFESELRLTGTASHPKLDGQLRILDIGLPSPAGLPPLNAELRFTTTNDTLGVRGGVRDSTAGLVTLDAEAPLMVSDWANSPELINDATFKAHAVVEKLSFKRLESLVPQLKTRSAVGSLELDVVASGTVAEPELNGNLAVSLDRLLLPDTPFRKIENSNILVRFEGRNLFLDPSLLNIAGGKITLSGDGSLEGDKPEFNIGLVATHALLWRGDGYSVRANAGLTLSGTPDKAELAGSVDIVESLVYKDIEIIPIGVPTGAVPKPSLPKIDTVDTGGPLFSTPAPFSEWTLDVKLRTLDAILIRGNLATGEIRANTSISGTISNPEPSGTIELRDIAADLPFSTLDIEKGSIILRPDAPLNPTLDIRGTSSINRRRVSMLVFGPLNDPKYTLNSVPPLPESEILSLIATGSTTEDLEDTGTASMKAFQLMIEELRRRNSDASGNAAMKAILKQLEDVELNVGQNDPFTGRNFSSATLELTDKYYLSAGFDAEGHTRASIIYSLRLR